jgi:hypothetical protein
MPNKNNQENSFFWVFIIIFIVLLTIVPFLSVSFTAYLYTLLTDLNDGRITFFEAVGLHKRRISDQESRVIQSIMAKAVGHTLSTLGGDTRSLDRSIKEGLEEWKYAFEEKYGTHYHYSRKELTIELAAIVMTRRVTDGGVEEWTASKELVENIPKELLYNTLTGTVDASSNAGGYSSFIDSFAVYFHYNPPPDLRSVMRSTSTALRGLNNSAIRPALPLNEDDADQDDDISLESYGHAGSESLARSSRSVISTSYPVSVRTAIEY